MAFAAVKLPVPYTAQFGPGSDAYDKDCGPSCSVMLLAAYTGEHMSPDDFYRSITTQDVYITKQQLAAKLKEKGIETENIRGITLDQLHGYLAGGRPGIALINYGALREKIKTEIPFTGPHFVLMVGMDDQNVYIHDPLWRRGSGAWLAVPHESWMYAWEKAKEQYSNPPCSALVVTKGVPNWSADNQAASALPMPSMPAPEGGYFVNQDIVNAFIVGAGEFKEKFTDWTKAAGVDSIYANRKATYTGPTLDTLPLPPEKVAVLLDAVKMTRADLTVAASNAAKF